MGVKRSPTLVQHWNSLRDTNISLPTFIHHLKTFLLLLFPLALSARLRCFTTCHISSLLLCYVSHCLPTQTGRSTSSVVQVPSLLQMITGLANRGMITYSSSHWMTARSPGIKPPDFSTTTPLLTSGSAQPPITARQQKHAQCGAIVHQNQLIRAHKN